MQFSFVKRLLIHVFQNFRSLFQLLVNTTFSIIYFFISNCSKPLGDRTFLIEEERQNRCQKHILRDSSWQASPDTYLMLSIKPTVACAMDSSLYQIAEPSTTREKKSCCSRSAVRQLKNSKLARLLR